MIVLDTNVVSEPLKGERASPAVLAWLDQQPAHTLFLASTSLAELLTGVQLLPEGKRKLALSHEIDQIIQQLFGPRILSFDTRAATAYALISSRARLAGSSISVTDAQIAAVAKIHGFAVASRDTMPFTAANLTVIDPWQTYLQ